MKKKKLLNLTSNIPNNIQQIDQNFQGRNLVYLNQLQLGLNKGKILSCKVTNMFNSKDDDGLNSYVVVDSLGAFSALTIYNADSSLNDLLRLYSDLYLIDPFVKVVKLDDKDLKYYVIQVFEIHHLIVDGQKVNDKFSPSIVSTKLFQN